MDKFERFPTEDQSNDDLPSKIESKFKHKTFDLSNGIKNDRDWTENSTLHPGRPRQDSKSCPDLAYLPHIDPFEPGTTLNGGTDIKKNSQDFSSSRGSTFWTSIRAVVRLRSAATAKRRVKKKSSARTDSFIEKFTTQQVGNAAAAVEADAEKNQKAGDAVGGENPDEYEILEFVASPDGDFLFYWLIIIFVVVLYNSWFVIAREAWSDLQSSVPALWFSLDYFGDFLFILDIIVQLRTGYLEHGLLVKDSWRLARNYLWSLYFVADILALLPTDFLYFVVGVHPILRFPRFLKFYRAREFYFKVETSTPHPNSLRLLNLVHLLLLLTHWFAAVYFITGELIGLRDGIWMYHHIGGADGNTTLRKYLASFYWSTVTLTTIGDIPTPQSNWEFFVQIIGYMMGVFIFATIVGQVGTVIENRNALRLEFERHVDHAKKYMREHKVPKDVQQTIIRWYDHTWSSGQMKGKGDVNTLGLLPAKLRTELALHVNLDTLKKVTIFQECPPEFLHELVLKMRFNIITPGDLVVRKGQIAREMFIISDGLLEVTGDDGRVLATLESGDFFGEIGILNLDGSSNKRTADVRSVGYSELFTLVKEDILGLLIDYPQAEKVLYKEGKKRLRQMMKTPDDNRELSSSTASSGGSHVIQNMRKTGVLRSPSSKYRSMKAHLSDTVKLAVQSAESSNSFTNSNKVVPLPTIHVSETKEKVKPLTGTAARGNDIARDVINSIEDIVIEKLEEVSQINKELRTRNEQLEGQILALQESNERKTDEIMSLRKCMKNMTVVTETMEESDF